MSMEITPKETRYNGYLFRSRLEARWAIYLDALGIEYSYEPETFDLGDGVYYLPDFYLPLFDSFMEIKPTLLHIDRRPEALARLIKKCVMVAAGAPNETKPLIRYGWFLKQTQPSFEFEFATIPAFIYSDHISQFTFDPDSHNFERLEDDTKAFLLPEIARFRNAIEQSKRRWS